MLSRWRPGAVERPLALRWPGLLEHPHAVIKPVTELPVRATAVRMLRRKWHGFTFPSKPVAGSAAQFNYGVSVVPPPHIFGKIHTHSRRHDGYTASSSSYALGKIGPKSVDVFTQALTNENVQVRFCAAVALADSKLQAASAVPELVNLLNDSSRDVRRAAVEAIGVIRARPEIAVPSLIDMFKDHEVLVRLNAAKALGRYGAYAKAAVPILETALNDDDPLMRKISEAALRQIRGD